MDAPLVLDGAPPVILGNKTSVTTTKDSTPCRKPRKTESSGVIIVTLSA
jgi:hypothetical protein